MQVHCISRCNIAKCRHNHIGTFLCQRIRVSRYVCMCVCVSGLCSVSTYPPNTLCTVSRCTIANWMPVWNTNHPFSHCHPCPLQTSHTFKPLHHLPHFEADILDTQSVFLYLEPFTRRQMNWYAGHVSAPCSTWQSLGMPSPSSSASETSATRAASNATPV